MCLSSYHLGSLGFYRDLVAAEIGEGETGSEGAAAALQVHQGPRYFFPDVHIASACLQKALRRSDEAAASAAATMLLEVDEERLWRRLCVVAFEDFGLVDLSVTARVVAVAASRSFRVVQGPQRALAHLIHLLCAQPKDRRLDDLYAVAAAAFIQREPRGAPVNPLAEIVGPLVHEAARLITRCERLVPRRSFGSLSPDACERALGEMARKGQADGGLLELCAKGARLSKCLLPVLLPIAIEASERAGGRGEVAAQELVDAPIIQSVPAYAVDGFTRVGRAVLARLCQEEPRLHALLQDLPSASRLDVLHHLLFFAEGSRCNALILDPLSQALTREAIACGARMPLAQAEEAVALMAELLPTVHRLRAELLAAFYPPAKEEEG